MDDYKGDANIPSAKDSAKILEKKLVIGATKTMLKKILIREINKWVVIFRYRKARIKAKNLHVKEWLKKWPKTRLAWKEIGYLVHVPYLMFQYKPHVRNPLLITNNMGFRSKEDYSHLPSVKPSADYRYIVLLGNSTAFGALSSSEDQCISAHLERVLNEAHPSGKRFKVINLSIGFYNSFQELISFILYGLKYNPEVVITLDGYTDCAISLDNKRIPLVSANYFNTKEILDKIQEADLQLKNKEIFDTKVTYNTDWDQESADFDSDVIELYKKNLELIAIIARAYKARVILCLQPFQVKPDGSFAPWRNNKELEKLYPKLAHAVAEAAKKQDAEFIDFHKIFCENSEYVGYFAHTDPVHLIDKGQEIVAQIMLKKISEVSK